MIREPIKRRLPGTGRIHDVGTLWCIYPRKTTCGAKTACALFWKRIVATRVQDQQVEPGSALFDLVQNVLHRDPKTTHKQIAAAVRSRNVGRQQDVFSTQLDSMACKEKHDFIAWANTPRKAFQFLETCNAVAVEQEFGFKPGLFKSGVDGAGVIPGFLQDWNVLVIVDTDHQRMTRLSVRFGRYCRSQKCNYDRKKDARDVLCH